MYSKGNYTGFSYYCYSQKIDYGDKKVENYISLGKKIFISLPKYRQAYSKSLPYYY